MFKHVGDFCGSQRAVSEVIGTVLLITVIISTVSVSGYIVLAQISEQARANGDFTNCKFEYKSDQVHITHVGGDAIAESELTIIFRNNSGTSQREFAIYDDDPGEQFDLGDTITVGDIDRKTEILLATSTTIVCQKTVAPRISTPMTVLTPTQTPASPVTSTTTTTTTTTTTSTPAGQAPTFTSKTATHKQPGQGAAKIKIKVKVSDQDGDLKETRITIWDSDSKTTTVKEATVDIGGGEAEIEKEYEGVTQGDSPYYVRVVIEDEAGHTTTWVTETENNS